MYDIASVIMVVVAVVIYVFVVPVSEVNLSHCLQYVEGYLHVYHQPVILIFVIRTQYFFILERCLYST